MNHDKDFLGKDPIKKTVIQISYTYTNSSNY